MGKKTQDKKATRIEVDLTFWAIIVKEVKNGKKR